MEKNSTSKKLIHFEWTSAEVFTNTNTSGEVKKNDEDHNSDVENTYEYSF